MLRIIDISPIRHSCAMLCLIYNSDGKVKITSKCTFFTFITRCLFQEHYANSGGLDEAVGVCLHCLHGVMFMIVLEARYEFAKM